LLLHLTRRSSRRATNESNPAPILYGIAFWPEFKGRDGCGTPIPWQSDHPHAGFTCLDAYAPEWGSRV
jgi:glycosidase